MELPHNKDVVYFAKTHYRNTEKIFGIQRKDRRQHMYVLGKSGMGKSTLLSNMLLQDIRNGDGVAIVDPHGEMVEDLLGVIPKERLADVVYFNPSDIDYHVGFNVLEVFDPKYKHLVASGIMGIFTKIWANVWSSRMEYILNNCILALIDTPGTTLLGIPRLLVDKNYRQMIVNNIKDPVVRTFWVHEYEAWEDRYRKEAIAPIQNKVGQFLSNSIVRNILGQQKSTISIPDIMNNQKIFLVNLSKGRVGEDNSALLGAMIITKLQLAAMERVKIAEGERKDFYLYVDEFQNFVTDSFATILSEARKYRLNLTIAHQYIAQLETESNTTVRDAVFGNVGTMIIGRVGAADAAFLETEFMPEFTPDDFVSLPNYHVYLKLLVNGMTTRPFSAKTLPPIVKMERRPKVEAFIINRSRELYHRPRHEVEEEITNWSNNNEQPSTQRPKVDADGKGSDGKYHVPCAFEDCDKVAHVPFKPEPGRPVYCFDCINEIKKGTKKVLSASRPDKPLIRQASPDGLAALGIEFKPITESQKQAKPKDQHQEPNPKPKPKQSEQRGRAKDQTNNQRSDQRQRQRRNRNTQRNDSYTQPNPKPTQDTPKPVPQPAPNKANPDPGSLRSALHDALGGIDLSTTQGSTKTEPKTSPSTTPKTPSISLASLRQDPSDETAPSSPQNPSPTPTNKIPRFDPTKQATNERVNALKDALAKAQAISSAETKPVIPDPPLRPNETEHPTQSAPQPRTKEPTPDKPTKPPDPPTRAEQREVPERLLKKIFEDNDNTE